MHKDIVMTNELVNAKYDEVESAKCYEEWSETIQKLGVGKQNQQQYNLASQKLMVLAKQELSHADAIYEILEDTFGYTPSEIKEIERSIGLKHK